MEPSVRLEDLLHQEGTNVEWKRTVADIRDVVATLCAFANDFLGIGIGGWVVCGATDDGHPIGLAEARTREVEGKVVQWCREAVSPPLVIDVHKLPTATPHSRVVVFYVPASTAAHSYRRKSGDEQHYVRSGSQTIEARGDLLRELLTKKGSQLPYLDSVCPSATRDDINLLAMEEFCGKAGLPRPPSEYLRPGESIDEIARPLVVRQQLAPGSYRDVPTRLAIVLFGRKPTQFLPGCHVVLAIYGTGSRAEPLIERFEERGPVPKLIRDVLDRLGLFTGIEVDKANGSNGANRLRYAERAVQETIVNAFAHRDYQSDEPIQVSVFPDRIEVENPGGVDVDRQLRLQRDNYLPKLRRNPGLARFLLRMHHAQAIGSGIPTIIEETQRVSGQSPAIDVSSGRIFVVKLPAYRSVSAPLTVSTVAAAGRDSVTRDGVLLISVSTLGSVRPAFERDAANLGLTGISVVGELWVPREVKESADIGAVAREIRDEVVGAVENPNVERLHLFYRGPNVLQVVIGAVVAGAKPLLVYDHHEDHYRLAYTIGRRHMINGG